MVVPDTTRAWSQSDPSAKCCSLWEVSGSPTSVRDMMVNGRFMAVEVSNCARIRGTVVDATARLCKLTAYSAYHNPTPHQEHPAYFRTSSGSQSPPSGDVHSQSNENMSLSPATTRDQQVVDSRDLLSRASNIVREATEVDGVIFLDARTTNLGNARVAKSDADHVSTGSDTDMTIEDAPERPCQILGVSTNEKADTDADDYNPATSLGHCSEKFLRRLLRRYPKGNIWHVEDLSSGEESDDSIITPIAGHQDELPHLGKQTEKPTVERTTLAAQLATVFPGARAIAFFPLFDTSRGRWFAGVSHCH